MDEINARSVAGIRATTYSQSETEGRLEGVDDQAYFPSPNIVTPFPSGAPHSVVPTSIGDVMLDRLQQAVDEADPGLCNGARGLEPSRSERREQLLAQVCV